MIFTNLVNPSHGFHFFLFHFQLLLPQVISPGGVFDLSVEDVEENHYHGQYQSGFGLKR